MCLSDDSVTRSERVNKLAAGSARFFTGPSVPLAFDRGSSVGQMFSLQEEQKPCLGSLHKVRTPLLPHSDAPTLFTILALGQQEHLFSRGRYLRRRLRIRCSQVGVA